MSLETIMTADAVETFVATGEVDPQTYDLLFDYFLRSGEMPYSTAKARDGDPHQWVADRLAEEYGQ